MPINLNPQAIDNALSLIDHGLTQYQTIQAMIDNGSDFANVDFRRTFNHFYRVRRPNDWQHQYYGLFDQIQNGDLTFGQALRQLHQQTGRIEASFLSKAFATFNTNLPLIDSRVLQIMGFRLPGVWRPDRIGEIIGLFECMSQQYEAFLATEDGQCLIEAFGQRYPDANISNIKKLDFVLWKAVR